jgi:hypothetical protein
MEGVQKRGFAEPGIGPNLLESRKQENGRKPPREQSGKEESEGFGIGGQGGATFVTDGLFISQELLTGSRLLLLDTNHMRCSRASMR